MTHTNQHQDVLTSFNDIHKMPPAGGRTESNDVSLDQNQWLADMLEAPQNNEMFNAECLEIEHALKRGRISPDQALQLLITAKEA